MKPYIEHANIDVSNLDNAVQFIRTALPDFRVRGRGVNNGVEWLHIGTDASYLALNEAGDPKSVRASQLNHIGIVVDDVAVIKRRLSTAGYREGFVVPPQPSRKRLYFLDADGLEWEFVEYASEDPAVCNDYTSY